MHRDNRQLDSLLDKPESVLILISIGCMLTWHWEERKPRTIASGVQMKAVVPISPNIATF